MQRLDTATIIGKEQSTLKVYLVGTLDRWNDAKKAEERDRVKHNLGSRRILNEQKMD